MMSIEVGVFECVASPLVMSDGSRKGRDQRAQPCFLNPDLINCVEQRLFTMLLDARLDDANTQVFRYLTTL